MGVLEIILLTVVAIFNILVVHAYTAREMYEDFIEDREIAGAILANIFYAPAWAIKGLQFILNRFSK